MKKDFEEILKRAWENDQMMMKRLKEIYDEIVDMLEGFEEE